MLGRREFLRANSAALLTLSPAYTEIPGIVPKVLSHPYLYFNLRSASQLTSVTGNEALRRIRRNIADSAEEFLAVTPPQTIPTGDPRIQYNDLYVRTNHALRTMALVEHYAFAYQIDRDERYLRQAKSWLLAIPQWKTDWGTPYSITRYLKALATGYDVLWPALTISEKKTIYDVLIEQGERYFHSHIEPNVDKELSPHHAIPEFAGAGIAALALLPEAPAVRTWLEAVLYKFENDLIPRGFAVDGGATGGTNYWSTQTQFLFQFLDAVRNTTGKDLYGRYREQLHREVYWPIYAYTGAKPARKETYTDYENVAFSPSFAQLDSIAPCLLRLASAYRDSTAQWVALQDPNLGRIQKTINRPLGGEAQIFAMGPYAYLWFDPQLPAAAPEKFPLVRHFRGINQVLLRDDWRSSRFFAGISGRSADSMNLLDFMLTIHGETLCGVAYLPENVRYNNQHTNTISLDGVDQVDGRIASFTQTHSYSYTQLDAHRFVRHFFFLPPDILVLFDEVNGPLSYPLPYKAAEKLPMPAVEWKLHSHGQVESRPGGFRVILGAAELEADILLPERPRLDVQQMRRYARIGGGSLDFITAGEPSIARLKVSADEPHSRRFLMLFSPGRLDRGRIRSRLLKTESGLGFEIAREDTIWTLFFNTSRMISVDGVATDGRQCLLEYRVNNSLRAIGLQGGTTLLRRKQIVVESQEPLSGGITWHSEFRLTAEFEMQRTAPVSFFSEVRPRVVRVNRANTPFVYSERSRLCTCQLPAGHWSLESRGD